MASSTTDDYMVVAAIDFGTTFCGYAFSVKGDGAILINKNWGAIVGCKSYKTPSCVLVGPKGEFVSFGYQAETDFTTNKQAVDGYNLYRHFKMLLNVDKLKKDSIIKSTTGTARQAVDIFVMALKYLKDDLLENIQNMKVNTLDQSMIKWVLTVPAIWSDGAKYFMRDAAYKAGLIQSIDSTQLLIALEPEAAALFCHSINVEHFKVTSGKLTFQKGKKYLVIDAGGGTVDITAHEILDSENVKEIIAPSGGPWGGTCADKAFIDLMCQIFDSKFIEKYKRVQPKDWFQIMLAFEMSKYVLKEVLKEDEKNNCNITLSYAFGKEHMRYTDADLEEVINGKESLGVSFRNGSLTINHERAKLLFSQAIQGIINHLTTLLAGLKRKGHTLDYVMLVGGFGHCDLLQKAVIKLFEPVCKVLIPLEPQLAVLKGAVIFGKKPSMIHNRIAQRSYGVDVMVPFIEGEHDPKYKDNFGGITYCSGLFKVLINKGEKLEVGTVKEHRVHTIQSETSIELYCSNEIEPKYTFGCQRLAKLTVKHPNTDENKFIVIHTTFGGTELTIKAKDEKSGTWVPTQVTFI